MMLLDHSWPIHHTEGGIPKHSYANQLNSETIDWLKVIVMTMIFFDESNHPKADFCLGAFVVFEKDPTQSVNEALRSYDFTPGRDEYKSRHPHTSDPRWIDLRRTLYRIAAGSRIGLVVTSYDDRASLGFHALAGLKHILTQNHIERPIAAYLDQGLFHSKLRFKQWRDDAGLSSDIHIMEECDSRLVPGIQVADLIAHTCAVVLLGRMGIADKTIRDDEEGEFELSFEMWARLRYNFFTQVLTNPELREEALGGLMDSHNGLYIAPECSEFLAYCADERFGRTWLGCIH